MAKSKQQRGKGAKPAAAMPERSERAADSKPEQTDDPLRAYPADPPRKHLRLLILSVLLFAAWFCYLAYVALRS